MLNDDVWIEAFNGNGYSHVVFQHKKLTNPNRSMGIINFTYDGQGGRLLLNFFGKGEINNLRYCFFFFSVNVTGRFDQIPHCLFD